MAEKAEPARNEHRQPFQKNADLFLCSSSFETVIASGREKTALKVVS